MAVATRSTELKTVMTPVTASVEIITLVMSPKEADTLMAILCRIGGTYDTRRIDVASIQTALVVANVSLRAGIDMTCIDGNIRFTPTSF